MPDNYPVHPSLAASHLLCLVLIALYQRSSKTLKVPCFWIWKHSLLTTISRYLIRKKNNFLPLIRLHGHMAPTYETASTRMFRLGRTDTIRTASLAAKAFCESMQSGKISVSVICLLSTMKKFLCAESGSQREFACVEGIYYYKYLIAEPTIVTKSSQCVVSLFHTSWNANQ